MAIKRIHQKGGIFAAILPRLLEIEKERDFSLLKPFQREVEEKAAIKPLQKIRIRKKVKK